jgi:RNA polymerase sigma factor (sigma-70 family)
MSSSQVGTVLRHIRKLASAGNDHELPDHQLLERFTLRRDEAAFAALLQRHGPMVLGVCRSVLHDLHDAEDAFQAAFLLLAQKAGSIHRREAVSGWLYRVAYHLAIRAKANAARRRVLEKKAAIMPSADPVLDMSLREVRAVLFEELEGLPEQYRAPLVLCGLEEKSLEEAARLLGWARGSVKWRLQRGRELLRARLRRRGLELPTALAATALALHSTSGKVAAALAESTLQAAVKVAASGGIVAGVASAPVAALVQGASKSMFSSKVQIATILLLALSLVAAALGVVRHQVVAADPPAAQNPAEKPKAQADPPKPAAEEIREVRGQVLDPEGKPVAGAKLYLAKSGEKRPAPSEQATSGPDGRFRFAIAKSELDNGVAETMQSPCQVMAVAEGHGCDWAKVGSAAEELTLRLVKDLPIHGRILDTDGKPVVGARLTVWSMSAPKGDDLGDYLKEARKGFGIPFAKDWRGPLPGQPAVLTTDTEGRFHLKGVGRERVIRFLLEGPAIASSYVAHVMTRASETVTAERGWRIYGATFDFVAAASRPIRGVVRDKATGKPLAGVSVGHYHGDLPAAVTDKEGRYELLGLAKGRQYVLEVKPADGLYFRRRVRLQDTPGLAALTGDIELTRGLTVRGRVTDKETGKPIAQARVEYHPLGGNTYANQLTDVSKPCAETITGPDGSYALTVMPGQGVIGVAGPRLEAYMPALVTPKQLTEFFKNPLVEQETGEDFLTVAAGANSFGAISQNSYNALLLIELGEKEEGLVKDVALERPLERKGRVVDPDDQPLTGVTVCGLVRHGVETLPGAEFTVRGINPRANRPLVFFHKDRNLGFYLKELRGDNSEPLTVKLQPCGSASGRIVDPDGAPLAELRLMVQGRALSILGEAGGGAHLVTTDKEGRFRVEGLVPGLEFRVSEAQISDGYLRIYAPALVEPGKHLNLGDIKMSPRDK